MEALRECKCGTKAFTEEDLELFCIHKHMKYGRRNECKSCVATTTRKYKEDNPDHGKEYYEANREALLEKKRLKDLENREELNRKAREYSKTPRGRALSDARKAKRRALKLQQTPEMTPQEEQRIKDMYLLAKELEVLNGEPYHVDHIQPLSKGGLHHPDNLQVIPADENLRKGAKLPEEFYNLT